MEFTFADAVRSLGPDAARTLINGARTPADYVFASILPERNVPDYSVESGSMTIRPLMAGLVAMDSPYPESYAMTADTFLAKSAKIASSVTFPEEALRRLQQMARDLQIGGGNALEAVVREVLNFEQTLLVQPHMDTAEWLRGQALLGGIDWTYNSKRINIDYGVPSANKPAQRSGTAAYNGSASVWWDDNRLAQALLRYNRTAVIMHSTTLDAIIRNPANNLIVTASNAVGGVGRHTLRRRELVNGVNVEATDARDAIDLITYDKEGEVRDPASPGGTLRIPFIKPGIVIHVGANAQTGYRVGAGSQTPNEYELGYTHIAPTTEGGGVVGRWARVFTPEAQPWGLRGEAVANLLPVIEAPEKIVVFRTDMPNP